MVHAHKRKGKRGLASRLQFEDARTSPPGDGSSLSPAVDGGFGLGVGEAHRDQHGAHHGNMSFHPRLGDELYGRLQPGSRPTEWTVTCREIANSWTGKLISRTSRLYAEGDEDWFWVYEIDGNEQRYWVSDSNFGRLPVSDKLRPRYVVALRTLLRLMDGEAVAGPGLNAPLCEMKGILNRCLRKDQWDWFTLSRYLGYPASTQLRYAAAQMQDLIKAAKRVDRDSGAKALSRLQEAIPRSAFDGCLRDMIDDRPKLEGPHRAAGAPREPQSRDATGLPLPQISRLKLERANEEHHRTLGLLSSALESRGYTVECNKLIDAFCHLKAGAAIFEVKSITGSNERSQCRHALSQLYEYRYLHTLENASLWIVLSAQPSTSWLIEYLLSVNIKVLWIDNGRIAGPSLSDFNFG